METTTRSWTGERTATRHPVARDEGFTFVEIVVTIVLIGVVLLPVLSAVRASVRAASNSGEAAEVETLLVNAIDRVNRANRGNFKCDFAPLVRAAVETHGWPASTVKVTQKYLNSAGSAWEDGVGTPPTACPATGFQNGMVQLITVELTGPQFGVKRTMQVVKGDV